MPQRNRRRGIALLAVVALGAALLAGGLRARGAGSQPAAAEAGSWQGVLGGPREQAALGQRMLVLLKEPSLADRVRRAGGRASERDERRWTAAALAVQKQLITTLAAQGVQIQPEFSYARVLNGFSAPLDARAVALLERLPAVAGIYPVRAAFPASVSSALSERVDMGATSRPFVTGLAGFDGRGVTVALLDTGVDEAHPFLRGRLQPGFDVVAGDEDARAETNPNDPAELESHGTEMAGILAGRGGPTGLRGVARRASVLPIRVTGWQPTVDGSWAVYTRTDQLIAGLERAVDPNGDGDAHDGARVALVSAAEPYAAFADGPVPEAVSGAMALDTLVVAPAGNDGLAGPAYGNISAPGGASAALTVGAADLRRRNETVRVVVRVGLDVELDRALPLVGGVLPEQPASLAVTVPRRRLDRSLTEPSAGGAGASLDQFFDRNGFSLVAGNAALVPAGDVPQRAAQNAARAGAAAVLLDGAELPPGSLSLAESVPVVRIPPRVARAVAAGIERGGKAVVSLGHRRAAPNAGARRVASFSSHGLAFGGRPKPDVVAPGLAVPTSQPGRNEDGSARFATVSGSSAAAAAAAGAAALLAQARPGLDAAASKSLLVGSARPLAGEPATAQGGGLLDVGAAAAREVAADPAALAFGGSTNARPTVRTLLLRNVSTRPLRLSFAVEVRPERAVVVSPSPRRLRLAPGRSARVEVRARPSRRPRRLTAVTGSLRVTPAGGVPLRVPWALTPPLRRAQLLGPPRLSATSFRPSDTAPAVLTFQAGRVRRTGRSSEILPVALLNVELWSGRERLGVLSRLRALLPGRYALGLTGRDPEGDRLEPATYRLRLVAFPPAKGPPSTRSATFTIR